MRRYLPTRTELMPALCVLGLGLFIIGLWVSVEDGPLALALGLSYSGLFTLAGLIIDAGLRGKL